jgi:hypothetical protein
MVGNHGMGRSLGAEAVSRAKARKCRLVRLDRPADVLAAVGGRRCRCGQPHIAQHSSVPGASIGRWPYELLTGVTTPFDFSPAWGAGDGFKMANALKTTMRALQAHPVPASAGHLPLRLVEGDTRGSQRGARSGGGVDGRHLYQLSR